MMICKNCGKTIDDHAAFCRFCGAQTGQPSITQPANTSANTDAYQTELNQNQKFQDLQRAERERNLATAKENNLLIKKGTIIYFGLAALCLFLAVGGGDNLSLILFGLATLIFGGLGVVSLIGVNEHNEAIQKAKEQLNKTKDIYFDDQNPR